VRATYTSILLAVTLFSLSCGGSSATRSQTSSGDSHPSLETVQPERRALLEAAGSNAAATIVFHPRHWSILNSIVTQIAGDLVPDGLRVLLAAAGPWPAARFLASEGRIELPRTLEGWDDSRPLLLALFEAPEISITELLALTDQEDPPEQLSHRIVIPATDATLLAQSLTEVARLTGCIDVPAPLAESFGSASAVVVCDDVFAVLETGDGLVRIRAAEFHRDDDAAPASLTRTASPPRAVTPALRWAVEGPVVIGAHVRSAELRAALLSYHATRIGRSSRYRSDDPNDWLYAERQKTGLLGTILRTSPVGAEVDDVTLGLVTGRHPTFTLVQGLTDVGVAAYDAGVEAPVPAEGPAGAPFVVRSAINVDVMQAVAGVPLGLSGAGDVDAAAESFSECGEPCYLHMLASRVFGLGALSDQVGLVSAIEGEVGPFFRFESADLAEGVTMELKFDFPGLVNRFGNDHFARQIADGLGVVHAVQVRDGRTIMTTARLGSDAPVPEIAAFTAGDPGPQGPGGARDEGAACVEGVTLALETVFRVRVDDFTGAAGEAIGATPCTGASEELLGLIAAWNDRRRVISEHQD